MTERVIIFKNPDGDNVCVCYPAELSVDELIGNYPDGKIVSSDTLPSTQFFDAWRFVNDEIVIDLDAAKQICIGKINDLAIQEVTQRNNNKSIGLPNAVSDEAWLNALNMKRNQINSVSTLEELATVQLTI